MRNADKIKGLENQNEQLRKRLADAERTLAEREKAAQQISDISEALMITLISRYGDPVENGARMVVLPKVDVAAVRGEYRIDFSEADKDGVRVLTVTKKKSEN